MNAWEAADLLEENQLEAAVEELSAERASFLEEGLVRLARRQRGSDAKRGMVEGIARRLRPE